MRLRLCSKCHSNRFSPWRCSGKNTCRVRTYSSRVDPTCHLFPAFSPGSVPGFSFSEGPYPNKMGKPLLAHQILKIHSCTPLSYSRSRALDPSRQEPSWSSRCDHDPSCIGVRSEMALDRARRRQNACAHGQERQHQASIRPTPRVP
jgi:hypothetical protein